MTHARAVIAFLILTAWLAGCAYAAQQRRARARAFCDVGYLVKPGELAGYVVVNTKRGPAGPFALYVPDSVCLLRKPTLPSVPPVDTAPVLQFDPTINYGIEEYVRQA